jgi:peptidoglycan hydrolase-like protein with peptidoglycan-binding domain
VGADRGANLSTIVVALHNCQRDLPAADPMVRATQQELVRLGYLSGGADGVAGPMTRSAISRFQTAQGLPATGQPSSGLLARLQSTPSGGGAGAATGAPASGTPAGGTSGSGSTASAPTNWVAPTTR